MTEQDLVGEELIKPELPPVDLEEAEREFAQAESDPNYYNTTEEWGWQGAQLIEETNSTKSQTKERMVRIMSQ